MNFLPVKLVVLVLAANGGSGGGIFNLADASHARLMTTSVISNFAGHGGSGGLFEGTGTGTDGSPGQDGSGPNLSGGFYD